MIAVELSGRRLVPVGVLAAALFLGRVLSSPGMAGNRALSASNGRRVYYEHCAACHNKQEKVASYLVDDTAFFVRAGLPVEAIGSLYRHPVRVRPQGSSMPAFTPAEISDADLDDLGAYLAAPTAPPTVPPALGSEKRGASLYSRYCAECHGAKGEGVRGMTPVAIMANSFKQANCPPNVMLAFVMLSARSGSVPKMPTYSEDSLSDVDLADIAAYIWSLPMP